ncbi:uncharacterized protein LOC131154833 [Malania oleifera]|uniref:uncharacterized protein LOC131154833 n=1 Tax=Malania oleifera TaxID=397392 RepID=UPI0025AEBF7F|nr:uncharacterized protein LOC131154833 [Malania oleifera]
MALLIYWYDFICFGIVAAALGGALWVIWLNEGGGRRCGDGTQYESLLIAETGGGGSGGCENGYVGAATKTGHVDSSRLWMPCWRGMHPGWLLLLRAAAAGVMAGFLAWDVHDWDAYIFVYYTEWTFSLVMVYFVIATIISAYGCWEYSNRPSDSQNEERATEDSTISTNSLVFKAKGCGNNIKLQSHQDEEELQRRAGFLGYLMQILYQTCAGAVILTDIVFWCVIVPFLSNTHLGLNMLMGCMHTLNAFFLLLETSIDSLPFSWFRLAYFVIWSCAYVIFQWVIHACGLTWWPYPFLVLSSPWAPLWYFCLAVLHIPCYGIYALITRAKISFFSRFFPHAFVKY